MPSTPNTRPPAAAGLLTVALLAVPALAAGCGSADTDTPGSSGMSTNAGTATVATGPSGDGGVRGVFQPWTAGATAVTYDPAAVPAGATAEVLLIPAADGVTVRLSVTGMTPGRPYGAHLHTAPCTAVPTQAGPHYQHRPDPKAAASPPSVDPAYANPRNEVWLDFTADQLGQATATATQAWTFDAATPPRSLVVHAQRTNTAPGKAGTAGPRVACLTLPA